MIPVGFGLDLGVILKNFNNKSAFKDLVHKECGLAINKILTVFLVILSIAALCISSVPNVLGAPTDVKILSYSWYIRPSTSYNNASDLIVIGEVQNTGSSILEYVGIRCVVYSPDGQAQAIRYYGAFVENMLPQQKAPFYLAILPHHSLLENPSWIDQGIDRFDLSVISADEVSEQQYPDLAVVANTSYIDTNKLYTVTGIIQNTGLNSTGKVWVVATFYNASGTAILVGVSGYLTNSLSPSSTVQFSVSPRDSTAELTSQISSYSLLIQSREPEAATPTPVVTESSSPSPTVSASSSVVPAQSQTSQSGGSPSGFVYVAVGLAVVVVAVVVVLLLRARRKPRSGSSLS